MTEQTPLEGLKVLELASVLAGPGVGMFFAELGATVIKVENVTTCGDVTRKWKLASEPEDTDISGYFSCVNWGKLSFAVDLCQQEGLQIIYDLVKQCDIVLVSYKPGDAEKLKVDYSTLKKNNPELIYAHITGYGTDNPRAGFDAIIQAEAGFTYINGQPDGPPTKMPVALMDVLAAHQLKEAILLALLFRERTGKGQYIETSLFRSGVASLANQASNWLVGGSVPRRMGSDHPNIVPYGTIFKTSDGKEIVLAAGTDKQFAQLMTILGKAELAKDARFEKNHGRVKNKEKINAIIQNLIMNYSREEILDLLQEKRIPAGGVFNIQEVFGVKEAQSMLLKAQTSDREIKGVRSVAFTTEKQKDNGTLSPPPAYGEHTHQVLSDILSCNEQKINNLIKKGVVYARNK